MTLVTPCLIEGSKIYNRDTTATTLSLAISLIDDFAQKEATGHLRVIINEGNIQPIKNLSGFYIFTDLEDGIYTIKITSELYFPEERIVDISKIKPSNLMLKFYTKGPASEATSTKLKDVSKLQKGDIVEFKNPDGDIEQKKITDVDNNTGKISWAGGLIYSFNTKDSSILTLKNPVVIILLKPLPSYPFRDYTTLVRGLVLDSDENSVVNATIKVANLNIETKSDEKGEFIIYFNDDKNENISIEIEKNGKYKLVNITLKEGIIRSLGKIILP